MGLLIPCLLLSTTPAFGYTPTAKQRQLLLKIEKDSTQYFIRMSDKTSGLTRDSSMQGSPASIAATGFALAALAIAGSHGWVSQEYAIERIERTLKLLVTKAAHEKGFFYHFLDRQSGKRVWGSEASSIDTALLVAGALLAGQYFPNSQIPRLAMQVYERVDWVWMMNETPLVSMGWVPESGFLPYYWDSYNELIILQALALGSPTFPLPREAWDAWHRFEDSFLDGEPFVYTHSGSLFTYQYSHGFIDFRHLNDRGINYFENSKHATVANWRYSNYYRSRHKAYSENSWGLSAGLGPGGYKAYGGKPGEGLHDGTITPYAAIGSIVFTPKQSIAATEFFYNTYKDKLYGHFGFKAGFNLDKRWFADQYIGIDQGITVLMLENYLNNGVVWEKFMQLPAIKRWIERCDLLR